jgi:hypothetical protein
MSSFPEDVAGILRSAGWTQARKVDVELWREHFEALGCTMSDAARGFLAEFGNLELGVSGRGTQRALEPITVDPMMCDGDEDRCIEWGTTLQHDIFPIGVFGGRFCLGIDECSEIYLMETYIATFGRMPEALSGLIRGQAPQLIARGG